MTPDQDTCPARGIQRPPLATVTNIRARPRRPHDWALDEPIPVEFNAWGWSVIYKQLRRSPLESVRALAVELAAQVKQAHDEVATS